MTDDNNEINIRNRRKEDAFQEIRSICEEMFVLERAIMTQRQKLDYVLSEFYPTLDEIKLPEKP